MSNKTLSNPELQITDQDLDSMLNRIMNQDYADQYSRQETKNIAALPVPPKMRAFETHYLKEDAPPRAARTAQTQRPTQRTGGVQQERRTTTTANYAPQSREMPENDWSATPRAQEPAGQPSTYSYWSYLKWQAKERINRFFYVLKRIVIILLKVSLVLALLLVGIIVYDSLRSGDSDSGSTTVEPTTIVTEPQNKDTNVTKKPKVTINASKYVIPDIIPNISQEELDIYAGNMQVKSLRRSGNTLVINTEPKAENLPQRMETLISNRLSTMYKTPECFHFESVTADDSYLTYTIIVNDVAMSASEKDAIQELFAYSAVYAGISGETPECIKIEFKNMIGNTIRVMQSTD